MIQIPRSIIQLLWITVLAACGPSTEHPQTDSEVMGFGALGRGNFSSFFRSPDIKPGSALFDSMKASIVRVSQARAFNKIEFAAKSEFQTAVFREVIKHRGVLSDQLHDTLRQILASSDCDGGSCARVFGVEPGQVDQLMDDMLVVAEKSEALQAPETASARDAIRNSLRRLKPEKTLAEIRGWIQSLKKGKTSTEGTCLVPAVTAFGIRSNGPFPEYTPANHGQKSVDYRNPQIHMKAQGSTTTCHTFAMTSLLSHSQQKGLTTAKSLDVERTVLAIWVAKLGRDVESALRDEVEFLQKLLRIHQDIVQLIPPVKRESADRLFMFRSFMTTKLYKAGGTSLENFDYLQEYGGVSQNAKRPPLDFKKVEELTSALTIARYKYLTTCIKERRPITPEGVNQALRQRLLNIFDFAKKADLTPDGTVARELKRFQHVQVNVDKADAAKTLDQITKALATHGPIYVSANGHATTLVGYDKDRRTFWFTDSQDKYSRPYISLAEENIIRNIKSYSYIKPRN